MIIGIVGAAQDKFTVRGEERAKAVIRGLLGFGREKDIWLCSGHCHLGGIDIWAEEIALEYGCLREDLIFPPKCHSWAAGYRSRNIQIATASNMVVSIAVDQLPEGFNGHPPLGPAYASKVSGRCYHCLGHGEITPHVKSGGCWTRWYAEAVLKKPGQTIIVPNGEQA